jgi:DNA-binding beta-propeller fold protein YncE
MRTLLGLTPVFCGLAMIVGAGCGSSAPESDQGVAQPRAASYEVWTVDQSDTPGAAYGGTLYVFAGEDLQAPDPSDARPVAVVNLAAETSALCRERTGANPVRPHMLVFNDRHTHASLAFVASGHVVIFDAATRAPVECMRTSQSPTGQQAHAAFPAPNGSYILVANQNGKRLERIDADFAAGRFTPNPEATLDLATCTTPSGAPCQAEGVRPDNAPICPSISAASDLAFVTLRGGGLLVVDPRPTPMRIVAEYDMATVKGNGCGGAQVDDRMYVNSGGRPGPMEHLHLYGFDVYRFALDAFDTEAPAPPNTPAPVVVFQAEGEHDSHGMVATGGGAYVWVMDRHADLVEVVATADDAHVGTIALNGVFTDDAAPDLTDITPEGDRVFVAFRGPTPLSGDPHIATGSTPGLAVLDVLDGGRSGRVAGLIRLTNVGEDGVERADPHAVRVRHLR